MAPPSPPRWTADDLSGARLGIYARASDDDTDTEASVTAQSRAGEQFAASRDITNIAHYCDNDLSASLYATKARADFGRLVADIAAGRLDLVWFWKLNRSQRTLAAYVQLRDLCRAMGVGWVIKRRIYDLSSPEDLRVLGTDAVNGEIFSIELSENVSLGTLMAAAQGKPHGAPAYGYRRIYDGRGRYVAEVPDDTIREVATADGELVRYSPAAVAIEIITGVAKGRSIAQLVRDLAARAIPSPTGLPRWDRDTLRSIATNQTYLGTRVHRPISGERTETPGAWVCIVGDEPGAAEAFTETFWAAQAVLSDPARRKTKPGRGLHLLSYVAQCVCGNRMSAKVDVRRSRVDGRPTSTRRTYACYPSRCSSAPADELDAFVRETIDAYLAREDVRAHLATSRADDHGAVAARAEADRLRGELETWRRLGEQGEDALTVLRSVNGLKVRIEEQESLAARLSSAPVLRSGSVDWADMAAARQSVAYLAEITLHPVGRGRRHVPMSDRVTWRWLVGPDAEGPATEV